MFGWVGAVGVEEAEPCTFRLGKACLECRAIAVVGLMFHQAYLGIACGDLGRPIMGAIVHDEQI